MARTTKLNKNIIKGIVKHISKGVTPEIAAHLEGIATSTYYYWLERGREGIEPFSELLEKVIYARNEIRAKIEYQLAEEDPRFFATRSPIMREDNEVPGWHNFEKPHNIQVNVVTVSSIIDDAIEQVGAIDLLQLPNLEDNRIKYIGENNKNGTKHVSNNGTSPGTD